MICKDIIETILKSGGRFLKKNGEDGSWVEIHDETEIIDRVSRGFRNYKSRRDGSGASSSMYQDYHHYAARNNPRGERSKKAGY